MSANKKTATNEIKANRKTTAFYVREAVAYAELASETLENPGGFCEESAIHSINAAIAKLELSRRRLVRGIEARTNPNAFKRFGRGR